MTDRDLLAKAYSMLMFLPYGMAENKQDRRDLLEELSKKFAKPEEPKLSPVGIGVDVTPEGTHVVAVYRRSDAVEEMFYSHFHPLTKREWVGLTDDDCIEAQKNSWNEYKNGKELKFDGFKLCKNIEQLLKDKNT